ncbi:glycosyltransferase family 9 protein [Methylibium sp.]|uniref:glycosyltransferase family 9 protein n=1 Tax=Methylibium sp. TaxID=2067992 RepID=UPI001827BBC5|nr:glycosyltransferase family 9 protein [Methylibium sp.]MBA3589990.1 glycosyltransferase family 9 protein [Methylibium sp.]
MNAQLARVETARWRWHAARNVLAVRLDNLGDLLMTTPALAAVRCSLPKARLTLLTSPSGAVLAPHLPVVDDVIAFEAPWVRSPHPGSASETAMLGQAEARMIDRLAEGAFDAAIVFTVCTQSALPAALLCRMAGIPLRLAHSRENPYGLLSDWVVDTEVVGDGMRHEVERQLALVATVGLHPQDERLRFSYAAGDAWRLRDRLSAAGLDPYKPYFVVHAGATASSRRYPAEQFGRAAEQIVQQSGCTAIFTGDAGERGLIEQARAVMTQPSLSLAGELQLGELAALIAGAEVLVSNNTGPVHIAAAVATPVVDLYALTNPQHTPWKVSSRVLNHPVPCRNCLKSECPLGHHDCLEKVDPQAIVRASMELMGTGPAVPLHSAVMSSVLRQRPTERSMLAHAAP